HGALDLDRDSGNGFGDRRDARLVLVAQRQVEHQIEVPADPELGELRRDLGRGLGGRSPAPSPPQVAAGSGPQFPSTATASASTRAPRGSEATPTTARAG